MFQLFLEHFFILNTSKSKVKTKTSKTIDKRPKKYYTEY